MSNPTLLRRFTYGDQFDQAKTPLAELLSLCQLQEGDREALQEAIRTKADVVMLVTTGGFTTAAVDYANQVTDNSRYYIILLDNKDIARIIEDRARIVDILNVKARRVFAKKELGITEFGEEYEDNTV